MPVVSSCPKCDASVLVPDGVDPSAKAKCPLCDEQFELQETLGKLPPLLEIVDQPKRPARPALAAAPAAAAAAAVDAGVASDDDALFGDFVADGAADDEAADGLNEMFAVESTDEDAAPTAGDSGSGFGGIDFGEMSDEGDQGAGGGGGAVLDTSADPAPASLASKARPKKKGPGPLFHIVGIAGFGVVGLMIGYVILLMIKGPQGDFLKIGKYLPSFIYSADDNGSGDNPEVVVKSDSKKSKNSKKNGGSFKGGDDGEKLSTLNFDFDNPGKKNGKSNKGPKADPIGPTALAETLRVDIEDAIDKVAVEATKLAAMQEMVDAGEATSGTGNLSDLDRAIRDHYFALAHLGLTMASAKPGSLDDQDLTDRIRQYVQNASLNLDTFDGIGEKATIWLNYDQVVDDDGNVTKKGRGDRNGILIAGVIRSVGLSARSPTYAAKVQIAGTDEMVTVVGPGNPPTAGSPVLLLGAIVENPKENLAGYKGDVEKVVWLCLAANKPKKGDLLDVDLTPVKPAPGPTAVDEPAVDEPKVDTSDIEQPKIELEDPALPELDTTEPELDTTELESPKLD